MIDANSSYLNYDMRASKLFLYIKDAKGTQVHLIKQLYIADLIKWQIKMFLSIHIFQNINKQ